MEKCTSTEFKNLSYNLLKILLPNNNQRQQGEEIIKKFCQNENCIFLLYQQIKNSPREEVRLIASVILRIQIKVHWVDETIGRKKMDEIKDGLINILPIEKSRPVIRSLINLIIEIYFYESQYVSLDNFLKMCLTAGNSSYIREIGVQLFGIILDQTETYNTVGYLTNIGKFLSSILVNPSTSKRMKIYTLETMENLIEVNKEYKFLFVYKVTIPHILKLMEQELKAYSGKNYDTEVLMLLFNIIMHVAFTESLETEFLKILMYLINIVIKIGKNIQRFGLRIIEQCIDFLTLCLKYHPAFIMKSKLNDQILQLIQILVCVEETEQQLLNDDENSIFRNGCSLLDMYSVTYPSRIVFPELSKMAEDLINKGYQTKQTNLITAGVSIIGVSTEGSFEQVQNNFPKFINSFIKIYETVNSIGTKRACVYSILHFCQFCQPKIFNYSDIILPFSIKCLTSNHWKIRDKTCSMIEYFTENLQREKLLPYSKELIELVFKLIKVSGKETQENLISMLSSVIEVIDDKYIPYFQPTISLTGNLINKCNTPKYAYLKAKSIECVGILAKAVGKKVFNKKYYENFIKIIFSIIKNSENSEKYIIMYSFNALKNIAFCIKKDFLPYVEYTLLMIRYYLGLVDIEVIRKTPGIFLEGPKSGPFKAEDLKGLDANDYSIQVLGHILTIKSCALRCMGEVALALGVEFSKYYDKTSNDIHRFCFHFHEPIQKAAVNSLRKLLSSPIIPNQKFKGNTEDSIKIQNNFFNSISHLLKTIIKVESKEVVKEIFINISELIKSYGRIVINRNELKLCELLVKAVKEELICFEEEKFVHNLEADHDRVIIDQLFDLYDETAKCIGEQFEKYFQESLPYILKLLNHHAIETKVTMLGTLSEMIIALKSKFTKYIPITLPLIFKYFNDPKNNEDIFRNSFVIFGNFALYTPSVFSRSDMTNYLKICLQKIIFVIGNKKNFDQKVVDNAVSLIGKFLRIDIKVHNFHIIENSFRQFFLLFLSNLPLQEDIQENVISFNCLTYLILNRIGAVQNYLPAIFSMYAKTIMAGNRTGNMSLEIKKTILIVLRNLSKQSYQQVKKVINSMNNENEKLIIESVIQKIIRLESNKDNKK